MTCRSEMERQAYTLKEVAEILGVSYWTVYESRHRIAFRLSPKGNWRVWKKTLDTLLPSGKLESLSVRVNGDLRCQSTDAQSPRYGGSRSRTQLDEELDSLLVRKTVVRPRNCTTG
jgi:hypothetical protein